MKNKPTKHTFSVLYQICKLIPSGMVAKMARKHGVDEKSRDFSPWSHVLALIYSQLAHCVGLNDACDGLRNHAAIVASIKGARPPSRNGLSHANRNRNSEMAKDLFWSIQKHLQNIHPSFGKNSRKYMPQRFKRMIHAVDSSTIKLVANSIDWARHRRRKAAAKLHLRLNLQSFLPNFAIVDSAAHSDPKKARELCANIEAGEITIFDKAYIDYEHLFDLERREIFWVTRAKENMAFLSLENLEIGSNTRIVKDELILLSEKTSNEHYPTPMRRIEAWVELDNECRLMTFITNNLSWAPSSICDLYKSRWKIEVFFKQIKQTLQLCDFLGHNESAVNWQVWISLLVYVLMRFLAHQCNWGHSFKRLFTLIRAILWDKYWLYDLLDRYGTAGGSIKLLSMPQEAYLPGFESLGK